MRFKLRVLSFLFGGLGIVSVINGFSCVYSMDHEHMSDRLCDIWRGSGMYDDINMMLREFHANRPERLRDFLFKCIDDDDVTKLGALFALCTCHADRIKIVNMEKDMEYSEYRERMERMPDVYYMECAERMEDAEWLEDSEYMGDIGDIRHSISVPALVYALDMGRIDIVRCLILNGARDCGTLAYLLLDNPKGCLRLRDSGSAKLTGEPQKKRIPDSGSETAGIAGKRMLWVDDSIGESSSKRERLSMSDPEMPVLDFDSPMVEVATNRRQKPEETLEQKLYKRL